MKLSLKLITLVSIFLFPAIGFSNPVNCTQIKNDVRTFCGLLEVQCESIKSCLTRKDTCLKSGKPTSETSCNELNTCVKEIEGDLPSNERCEYYWASSTDKRFCMSKGHFLFRKEGCPGRFSGLLRTIAYGFDASLDDEFQCIGTYHVYSAYIKSCNDIKDQFAASCVKSDSDREFLANAGKQSCEVYNRFHSYPAGHFSLNTSDSTRVDQSSRNQIKDIQKDDTSVQKSGRSSGKSR